jgi:hypothetical protein
MQLDQGDLLACERPYNINDPEHYRVEGRSRYFLDEIEPNWKPQSPDDPCLLLPEKERWYNKRFMKVGRWASL